MSDQTRVDPRPFTEEDRERLQTWINGWTRIRADADAASLARALAYIEQLETQTTRAEELMWQAAGLGAIAVMKDAPDVVMPTEIIEEGMQAILAEHRHPTTEAHDDG